MKLGKVIAILVLFVSPCFAKGGEVSDNRTYLYEIGEQVTIAWDPVSNAEWYDVRGQHYEQKTEVSKPEWQNLTQTQLTITIPRYGHITWEVRACMKDCTNTSQSNCNDGQPECSTYSSSGDADAAQSNQPWWTYGYVGAPGGGGIN